MVFGQLASDKKKEKMSKSHGFDLRTSDVVAAAQPLPVPQLTTDQFRKKNSAEEFPFKDVMTAFGFAPLAA